MAFEPSKYIKAGSFSAAYREVPCPDGARKSAVRTNVSLSGAIAHAPISRFHTVIKSAKRRRKQRFGDRTDQTKRAPFFAHGDTVADRESRSFPGIA